jgi:hypothetical protein
MHFKLQRRIAANRPEEFPALSTLQKSFPHSWISLNAQSGPALSLKPQRVAASNAVQCADFHEDAALWKGQILGDPAISPYSE